MNFIQAFSYLYTLMVRYMEGMNRNSRENGIVGNECIA
jgi:hypothetical protein